MLDQAIGARAAPSRGRSVSRGRAAKGQATAEFGLVVGVLVFMMLGIVDFSRLVAMQSAVITASREAARYGSAVGDAAGYASPTEPQYLSCRGIRDAARRVIGGVITLTDSTIAIGYDDGLNPPTARGSCPASGEGGPTADTISRLDRIVVTVTATYGPVSPIRVLVPSITVVSTDRRTIVKTR